MLGHVQGHSRLELQLLFDDSPYHFVTGHHIDIKYLHSFFAECCLFIPLKDRDSKLPARRAHRCRYLACSYTTLLVPTYVVIIVHDNCSYGPQCVSKDIIFDESCVFDKYIDNSPSDAKFAALALPIEDITVINRGITLTWRSPEVE